jgi:hypothetical protein
MNSSWIGSALWLAPFCCGSVVRGRKGLANPMSFQQPAATAALRHSVYLQAKVFRRRGHLRLSTSMSRGGLRRAPRFSSQCWPRGRHSIWLPGAHSTWRLAQRPDLGGSEATPLTTSAPFTHHASTALRIEVIRARAVASGVAARTCVVGAAASALARRGRHPTECGTAN